MPLANNPYSQFPVSPSTVPYHQAGQSFLARPADFGDPGVQDAIKGGAEFDKWISNDVLPLLRRSGGLQEVLAATGHTGLNDQYEIKGSIGDVPFSGKADLVLWKGDRASTVIDIKRSSGNSGVDYIYQIAAYAKGLQQSNLLMNTGAKIGTASVLPSHANDLMTRYYNAPSEADQVSVAKEALKSIISGTSGTHLDMKDVPANSEFIPGGKIYQGFKSVADEMLTVNRITGESPRTLARQQIPAGLESKYQSLYDAVIAATQAVMSGQVTVEQAKNYLARQSQGLPFNTAGVKPVVYDTAKISGSNQYGDVRVGWGHPIQNPALGMGGVERGGAVKVPTGIPGTWTQPSAFTGQISQFGARPVLGSTVITRIQNPADPSDVFEPGILDKLAETFKSAGGGAEGARQVAQTLQDLTRGMPQVSKDWQYTSTAAAQAMMQQMVTIPQEMNLSTQEWYARSGDLVRRGSDPHSAFPLTPTIAAGLGNLVLGGTARIGETSPEKAEKRLQQILRKTDMIYNDPAAEAHRQFSRNIASPFIAEGATSREFGMRYKMMVANILPEGQGFIDAETLRKTGGMVHRATKDVSIMTGVSFEQVKPYQEKGQWIVGKTNGGALPLDASAWTSVQDVATEIVTENGQQILRIQVQGMIDPNSTAVKSWYGIKAMNRGYEGLTQAVSGATVEGIMPMFKNIRQAMGVVLSGRYGSGQVGMNVLMRQLKARGVDVSQYTEQTSAEELEKAQVIGANLPAQRLRWQGAQMDEALIDLTSQIVKSKFRDPTGANSVTFTTAMSYENYLIYQRGMGRVLGPGSVSADDPTSWAQNQNERRQVTLRAPALVMNLFQQFGREYEGRARVSYEEITDLLRNPGQYDDKYAQAILGNVFPNLSELSGHKRQYYESILKSVVGSRSPSMRENMQTVTIDDLSERMKGIEGSFITKLQKAAAGSYIDVGNGQLLPPGDIMSIMSVESPMAKMLGDQELETPLPYEQHNAIIHLLDKITKSEPGGYRDKLRAALMGKFSDLASAGAVVEGLLSVDVTGSGGFEEGYTAELSTRPWEVLAGGRALQRLVGPKGFATAREAIARGFRAVGLATRRPVSHPMGGAEVPMAIQTQESLAALGAKHLPREFAETGGMAFSPAQMEKAEGDFDADRARLILASEYRKGALFTKNGIADAATEQAWVTNAFLSLENKLGRTVGVPRTFQGYLDALGSLGDQGMKISELSKWIHELGKQASGPEGFFNARQAAFGLSISNIKQGYMGAEIAKEAKGPIYNLLNRNLGVLGKFFGKDYEAAEGRARYYGQQASLDITELSEGLRTLIGIAHTYTVSADPSDVTGGRGRFGYIVDKLTMKMGPLESRQVAWKDLPNEIIKAALSSTELRGFGGLNASFAQDIGRLLSTDSSRAARIAELISSGKDVESTTSAIRGLYSNLGDFWKSGGPLVALLGSHMMKRGLNAKGIPNEIAQSLMRDEGFTSFEGGIPSGGMGLFGLLKDPMMAMQRVQGGQSGQQGRGVRGVLEDLVVAGASAFSPSKMAEMMGAFSETMKRSLREVLGNIQGFANDSPDKYLAKLTPWQARIQAIFDAEGVSEMDLQKASGGDPEARGVLFNALGRGRAKVRPGYFTQLSKDAEANAQTFQQSGSDLLSRLRSVAINPAAEPAGQAEANVVIGSHRTIPQSTQTPAGSTRGGRRGGVPVADALREGAWYKPAGSDVMFPIPERSAEGELRAKRGSRYEELIGSIYAGEAGLPSEREALEMQRRGELHKGGVAALRAARTGKAAGISGELEFLSKIGRLGGSEEGQAGLGDMYKAIADRSAQLEKFGGAIDLATKNVGAMNKVLDRWGAEEKLSPNELAQQRLFAGAQGQGGIMAQVASLRPEVIQERLRQMGQEQEAPALLKTVARYRDLEQKNLESIARGEGPIVPGRGGGGGGDGSWVERYTPSGRGIFAGDWGSMYFGMLNVNRAWQYTGGQVTRPMQDYAQYAAQQQYLGAELGEGVGFTGAAATTMGVQAQMKQFGLGVGRAGWNRWGWIAEGVSKTLDGNDPERPNALQDVIATAAPVVGGLLTSAVLANFVKRLTGDNANLRWVSAGLNAPTQVLGDIMTTSVSGNIGNLAGGISSGLGAAGQSIRGGYDALRVASAFGPSGMASAAGNAVGTGLQSAAGFALTAPLWQSGLATVAGLGAGAAIGNWGMNLLQGTTYTLPQRAQQAGDLFSQVGAMTRGMLSASAQYGWGLSGQQPGQEEWMKTFGAATLAEYEKGLTPEQKLYNQQMGGFSTIAMAAQQQKPGLDIEALKQVAALYSRVAGRSTAQMNETINPSDITQGRSVLLGGYGQSEPQFIAELASAPSELQQRAIDYMQRMGRAQGLRPGQQGWAQIGSEFLNAQPAQQIQATETAQNMSQFTETARRLGVGLPNLSVDQMSQMSYRQQAMYNAAASGDQRVMSSFAAAARLGGAGNGLGIFETLEPTGYQVGTTDVSSFTAADWTRARGLLGMGGMGATRSGFAIDKSNRDIQWAQQQYGLETQQFNLGLGAAQQMGGTFGGVTFAGSYNLQQQNMMLAYQNQQRQFAQQGGTMGGGFGFMGMDPGALQGLGIAQLGTAGLSYRQFYEDRGVQRQRMDIGYAQQDITAQRSYGRQQTQMDWSLADLATNYARSKQQFGWAEEGLAFQGMRSGLQFGWQMQDIDESMRYATGRERRQLSRQKERAVIEFGLGQEALTREEKQLKEKEKWADQDFAKETDRAKTRRGWLDEDFNLDKKYRLDLRSLDEQSFELQKKQFEENMASSKMAFEANVKAAGAAHVLDLKAAADSLGAWTLSNDKAKESLQKETEWANALKLNRDEEAVLSVAQQQRVNDANTAMALFQQSYADFIKMMAADLGEGGTLFQAWKNLIDNQQNYVFQAALETGGATYIAHAPR